MSRVTLWRFGEEERFSAGMALVRGVYIAAGRRGGGAGRSRQVDGRGLETRGCFGLCGEHVVRWAGRDTRHAVETVRYNDLHSGAGEWCSVGAGGVPPQIALSHTIDRTAANVNLASEFECSSHVKSWHVKLYSS